MGQSNSTYMSNRSNRAALTKHARVRAQQRGISQDDVKLITPLATAATTTKAAFVA